MNRNAIKARLIKIISMVAVECMKHPKEWYPVEPLRELLKYIEDHDATELLAETGPIRYKMIDEFFDYHDIVFKVVMKFCYDIQRLGSLKRAISILKKAGNSEDNIQMLQLLTEWLSKFPEDGNIPEDIDNHFSDEYIKLFNKVPEYWGKAFPESLRRMLPVGEQKASLPGIK